MDFSLELGQVLIAVPEGREYLYKLYRDHIRALDKIAKTHKDLAIRFRAVELLVMVGRAMAGLLDASEEQRIDEEIKMLREKVGV